MSNLIRQTSEGYTALFPWGYALKLGWIIQPEQIENAKNAEAKMKRASFPIYALSFTLLMYLYRQNGLSFEMLAIAVLSSALTGLYPLSRGQVGPRYSKQRHGNLLAEDS